MAEKATKSYERFTFTICLAYGGREEIIDAVKSLAKEHADGRLGLDSIDVNAISSRLYTSSLPDPDLVIRTSGEERISISFYGRSHTPSSTSPTSIGLLSLGKTYTGQ